MKISKTTFLFLFWLTAGLVGILIPMACTNTSSNFVPTQPSTPVVPSATATNAFGYTSTPTFTLIPTSTITNTPVVTPMLGTATPISKPNVPSGISTNPSLISLYVSGGDGNVSVYPLAGGSASSVVNSYNSVLFGSLTGVAVEPGPSPHYYVLDSGTNAVYEFDSSNNPINTWNNYNGMAFNAPKGIAVDSSKNVYVVDTGNNVVDEFTASGAATVRQWGYSGSGSGYFNNPTGIAIGTAATVTIYVADMGNSLIQEFTSAGVYISQFSTVSGCGVELGISVDSSGNIFTADYQNGQIEKYNSAGSWIKKWAGPSFIVNPFAPSGVVDAGGTTLYVTDYANNAIYQVAP